MALTWPGGLSVMSLCLAELISEAHSAGCRCGSEVLVEVLGCLLFRPAIASVELSSPGKLIEEAVNKRFVLSRSLTLVVFFLTKHTTKKGHH